MKVIAITGESGTGKTTIASYLESKGAVRINADAIGHELLSEDHNIEEDILKVFGERVFQESGEINRKALAREVFTRPEALRTLNAMLHPAIIEVIARKIEELEKQGVKLVVVDAALILEVDLPFKPDFTIALICSREEQARRLRESGDNEEDIKIRLKSQEHLKRMFHKADVLLNTIKSKEEVFKEVDEILYKFILEND